MDEDKLKYLKEIWYNPKSPAAYSGIDKLYKKVKSDNRYKITKSQVGKWLKAQQDHTTFKELRKRFPRVKVIVPSSEYMNDSDVGYMLKYGEFNNGYKYIFVVVDVLSRKAYTAPLKNITARSVIQALEQMFKKGLVTKVIRGDRGSEQRAREMQTFLRKKNIKQILTNNETKSNYAER
jgi:transposase InsO family protein